MAKGKAQANTSLNGLMTALLNGNPAVQQQLAQSGKSLDEVLGAASAGQAPAEGATRGGLIDLFGGSGGGGGDQAGGGDILGSLLGSMMGGAGGGMPSQGAGGGTGGGGDMLGSLLGSLLGGSGQPQIPPQGETSPGAGAGGADADALGGLLGMTLGGSGGGQAPNQSPIPGAGGSTAGGDIVGSLLGSLMGGGAGAASSGVQQGGGADAGPIGSLLGGLLGVGGGTGSAGGGIANGFVTPIASAIAKQTGIPEAIAQAVVAFALQKLMSSATGQSQGRFDPVDLVSTLASDGKVSSKYLKDSGLAADLAQQAGLDPKTATKSLQQAFAALSTHIGDANATDQQAELDRVLRNLK